MFKLRWLLAFLVALSAVAALVLFVFLPTATLEIKNESDNPVTVRVDTRIRREIPPHSSEKLYAGILLRRWGPPATIRFDLVECTWSEVKRNEPVIITDNGPNCSDLRQGFPR